MILTPKALLNKKLTCCLERIRRSMNEEYASKPYNAETKQNANRKRMLLLCHSSAQLKYITIKILETECANQFFTFLSLYLT
jgi:hypothetical protein